MISSSPPALVRRIRPRADVDLPEELIELILSKCPVKSVVRFESVSKSWQSLISDPRFSKSHRIQQARLWGDEKRFIILAKEKKLGARIYLVKSEEVEEKTFLELPFYFTEGIFRIESVLPYPSPIFNIPLCSCNGLILFAQKGNNQHYMLWNPSIRKHTIITWPWSTFAPRHNFYYDSTTDDHKIVFSDENCYTVYSCNKGDWSEIEVFPGDLTPKYYLYRGVCVDGRFYNLVDKYNGEIVCFDTRDGNLHKFRKPDEVKRVVALWAASGRLYLYGYVKEDDERFHKWAMEKHGRSSLEKWVMDNKSSLPVRRKLMEMGNEKVADLYLEDHAHGVSSVRTCGYIALDPSHKSRIFPYSENLYMH